jgi:hypothetical protein
MINLPEVFTGVTKFELNIATIINILNSWLEEKFIDKESVELTSFHWKSDKGIFEVSFKIKDKDIKHQ